MAIMVSKLTYVIEQSHLGLWYPLVGTAAAAAATAAVCSGGHGHGLAIFISEEIIRD